MVFDLCFSCMVHFPGSRTTSVFQNGPIGVPKNFPSSRAAKCMTVLPLPSAVIPVRIPFCKGLPDFPENFRLLRKKLKSTRRIFFDLPVSQRFRHLKNDRFLLISPWEKTHTKTSSVIPSTRFRTLIFFFTVFPANRNYLPDYLPLFPSTDRDSPLPCEHSASKMDNPTVKSSILLFGPDSLTYKKTGIKHLAVFPSKAAEINCSMTIFPVRLAETWYWKWHWQIRILLSYISLSRH